MFLAVGRRKAARDRKQKTARDMAPKRERDGEPKRPLSASKMFFEERRATLTDEQKSLPAGEQNRILKEMFSVLSEKTKRVLLLPFSPLSLDLLSSLSS